MTIEGKQCTVATICNTFNQAPFIIKTLNGFAMQETSFPFVSLIVDDASTDGEPDVIRSYLSEYFKKPFREEETEDYQLICADHITNLNCRFVAIFLKYNHYSIKKNRNNYILIKS